MKYSGFTEGRKGRRVRHIRTTIMAWGLFLCVIALVAFAGFEIFTSLGYRSLKKHANSTGPQIVMEEGEESTEEESEPEVEEPGVEWQSDWVKFEGKVYDYNEDILTFLFLGIDKDGKVKPSKNGYSGGQSDVIFLAVVNPDIKGFSLIGINRDTMVEVFMPGMGPDGTDISKTGQIATQHGFGDGMEYSCELARDAVSKLFYDLPIHGYLAFNRGGIVALNDALGGVTVTIPEDMTNVKKSWKEGAEVTLKGRDAYNFICSRDEEEFESARKRLARQKQYISVAAKQTLEGTKKDITLPLTLYQAFQPYIVTDLSVDEISYLATKISDYSFDGNEIYTLEGETGVGEKFEEFYPDKKALKRLMFQIFYREVDPLTGEYIR